MTPLAQVAVTAAERVFEVLDRRPRIDPDARPDGVLDSVRGEVELRDVKFAYPSAPSNVVCDGYSLRVEAGSWSRCVARRARGRARSYSWSSGSTTRSRAW